MWGFWRPKVRLMLAEDPGVLLCRLIGEADGNAGLKRTAEFQRAHPISATYAALWDIRRFVGVVSDEDIVDLIKVGVAIRVGMGLPAKLDKPLVYLGNSYVAPGGGPTRAPIPDGLTAALQVTTIEDAWRAVAPGARLPRRVRNFFNAA